MRHLLLFLLVLIASGAEPTAKPPNIILIVIDDMGWTDLGVQGSTFYETPNLDRLAAGSLRFTNAYAACQVCSPSRAALMTGRSPAAVGITNYIGGERKATLLPAPYAHSLSTKEITLPKVLSAQGYRTTHLGKWHLGGDGSSPIDHGFQVNIGGGHWGSPPKGYFSPFGLPNLPDENAGRYLTDALTDAAIAAITEAGDRPFFLNLWHYTVHTPLQAPKALVAKYEAKAKALGLNLSPLTPGDRIPGNANPNHRIMYRTLQSHPTYAAMIESLDTNIGRLLTALKESGKDKNTIVIFTSDNGGLATAEGSPTCNAPLSDGKGWMQEGGIRVPLIIHWPGVITPGTSVIPVIGTDLMPTLVEASGAAPVPDREGTSLMPLLRGHTIPERSLYWHYPHYPNQGATPAGAIRRGDWKLIEWFEDGKVALYNVSIDPGEHHDFAAEQPDRVKSLQGDLAAWRTRVGARMPTHP